MTPQCALTCKIIKDVKTGTKRKLFIASIHWYELGNKESEARHTEVCMELRNLKEIRLVKVTQAMRVMQYEFLHSALLDLISSVGVVTLEGDAFTAGTQ